MRENELTPCELEELGQRLKDEFAEDRRIPNPVVEERLFRLARSELQDGQKEKSDHHG